MLVKCSSELNSLVGGNTANGDLSNFSSSNRIVVD